jgi:hypothetical protein
MKIIILLLLVEMLLACPACLAQTQAPDSVLTLVKLNKKGNYYFRYQARLYPGTLYHSKLDAPVTSLTIRIPLLSTFEGTYLVTGQKTYPLQVDKSLSESGAAAMQNSVLIFFEQPIQEFNLYSGKIKDKIELHMMYTDPSGNTQPKENGSGK